MMDIEPGGTEGYEIRFARKYLDSEELGISYGRLAPGAVSTEPDPR